MGETFFREDKCCTCLDKGINCVPTTANICYQGNKNNHRINYIIVKIAICIKLHNPGICIQSVKQCTNTPEQEIPFTKTTSITCKPL